MQCLPSQKHKGQMLLKEGLGILHPGYMIIVIMQLLEMLEDAQLQY